MVRPATVAPPHFQTFFIQTLIRTIVHRRARESARHSLSVHTAPLVLFLIISTRGTYFHHHPLVLASQLPPSLVRRSRDLCPTPVPDLPTAVRAPSPVTDLVRSGSSGTNHPPLITRPLASCGASDYCRLPSQSSGVAPIVCQICTDYLARFQLLPSANLFASVTPNNLNHDAPTRN
jgi:hypothetical protein